MESIKQKYYYLGCPQWTHKPWQGSLYPKSLHQSELYYYAKIFNTVEGNTSFYATPQQDILDKWKRDAGEGFKFLFKVHQSITHEYQLNPIAFQKYLEWQALFATLGEQLGVILIQLPPTMKYEHLDQLWRFLDQLSQYKLVNCSYAVELRDINCFTPHHQSQLQALLIQYQVEQAIMDTRPLRSASANESLATKIAQERKPNMPVYPIGLGPHPCIRYVAHPDLAQNKPFLTQWSEVFAHWISQGKKPYFFAHYPGEDLAPQLALQFHQMLQEKLIAFDIRLPDLPDFFGNQQLSLAF
jgi:uncharacterized protein YecE (DUF72 family)